MSSGIIVFDGKTGQLVKMINEIRFCTAGYVHINPDDRSKDRIFVASFSEVRIIDPSTF